MLMDRHLQLKRILKIVSTQSHATYIYVHNSIIQLFPLDFTSFLVIFMIHLLYEHGGGGINQQ